MHVLRELMEEAAAAAEQDGHLVQDELVHEPRLERLGDQAATHQGDVLVAGGRAGCADGILDAAGDEGLRLADLGRGPGG